MRLIAAPAFEPVTTGEAADAARIDSSSFSAILPGLIKSARQIAEHETGRRFIAQTWRIELGEWPSVCDVLPVYRPSAVVVSYWNGSAFVALSGFEWADVVGGFAIAPALGTSFPALGELAIGPRVRIDATVGATSSKGVEDCVKTFIKAMVAHWIRNPEAAQERTLEAAPFLRALLDPVRVYL